jgi:hypothetical protein
MRGIIATAVLSTLMACSITDIPDPSTIINPDVTRNQDGAVGLYRESVTSFALVFGGGNVGQAGTAYALADGLASDQYAVLFPGFGMPSAFTLRYISPELSTNVGVPDALLPYTDLHLTRLHIDQAIGALREFGVTTPPSLIGELFALKGFLYVTFGEMYCSGVPFSEAIYNGDIVLGAPLTTEEMFERAIAQFDTALAVATDSVRVQQLAHVGKARALLNLGQFAAAGAAASPATVPTTFVSNMRYSAEDFPNYKGYATGPFVFLADTYLPDRKGSNGLDYVSAGDTAGGRTPDPRVRWIMSGGFQPRPIPMKFSTGSAPVVLASGVEARLIEAEASLRANDIGGWAGILNSLRQTAITPAIPELTPDSTTAAPDTLRQNVMFRERAFWMLGTGHRLGDMRRLVRQYQRSPQTVFPIGQAIPSSFFYSDQTNFAPPRAEQETNPNFNGCFNRDA